MLLDTEKYNFLLLSVEVLVILFSQAEGQYDMHVIYSYSNSCISFLPFFVCVCV